jgi:double-stranded uracil-DNA glycosylase
MKSTGPSKQDLLAAHGATLPDLIAPGLKVLFCGINPGLYSGAVGHHFARPGNRFWPALHEAGFTDRLLDPAEEQELLKHGCGLTNLVNRATAGAAELSRGELVEGGRRLARKVRTYRPGLIAFLGVQTYRIACGRPGAVPGRQAGGMNGTVVWVLPSPSGRVTHYRFGDLVSRFRELKLASDAAG